MRSKQSRQQSPRRRKGRSPKQRTTNSLFLVIPVLRRRYHGIFYVPILQTFCQLNPGALRTLDVSPCHQPTTEQALGEYRELA